MEVGENDLVLADHPPLFRLRFLDLDDHFRRGKNLSRPRNHFRAMLQVLVVGDSRTEAGACFYQHLVAGAGQLFDTDGQQRHAVLIPFDLFGDANNHFDSPVLGQTPLNKARADSAGEGQFGS